jgi:hypothetical protein
MARMQAYFNSEFLASGLNSEMYDFLKRITQAKSKAVKYTTVLFFIKDADGRIRKKAVK